MEHDGEYSLAECITFVERILFRIKLAILINIISYQLMGLAESRCLDHQLVYDNAIRRELYLASYYLEQTVDLDGKVSTRVIHPDPLES